MSLDEEVIDTVEGEEEQVEEVVSEEETPSEEDDSTQDPHELLRALREDRKRDQEELQRANENVNFYRDLALRRREAGQPVQSPKFEKDDILTYGEVEATVGSKLSETQKQMRKMKCDMSEEIVKGKYPDYEDVVKTFVAPLVQEDPSLLDLIEESENPALTAYRLGLAQPGYAERQRKAVTQKVAEKIEKNLGKPKTLASAGSSGAKAQVKSYADMTSEEFAAARFKKFGF